MARIIMTAKKGSVSLVAISESYKLALALLMDEVDEHLNQGCQSQAAYDEAWERIHEEGLEGWLMASGFSFKAEPLSY